MSENYNDLTTKVLSALEEKPELLNAVVAESAEGAKRALMPGEDDEETKLLKSILGSQVSPEALAGVTQQLNGNSVMQLLSGAQGAIDPTELLSFVGGFSGANASKSAGVKALFDGKLDIKDILVLIGLIKMFKGTQSSSSGGLLSSLLGGGSQQTSSSGLGMLSNLLGGQTQQSVPSGLFGSLFQTAQPQQQASNVISLGGNTANNSELTSLLNNIMSGNTGNNSQAQQLYSLLNNSSSSALNSNGTVNVGTLFNLASQLMGK